VEDVGVGTGEIFGNGQRMRGLEQEQEGGNHRGKLRHLRSYAKG
jgi:hypothetical protein